MLELNALTAVPIGALAAAIWAIVAIRRLLRSAKFTHFSRGQRRVVWGVAAVVFVPALFVAFAGSVALTNLTVRPGPWNHLAMALTVCGGLGVLGAAITWGAATFIAILARGRGGRSESAV
jgi:multidrug transporter EmrE-like cation transporter